jgi:hypothetical protein
MADFPGHAPDSPGSYSSSTSIDIGGYFAATQEVVSGPVTLRQAIAAGLAKRTDLLQRFPLYVIDDALRAESVDQDATTVIFESEDE